MTHLQATVATVVAVFAPWCGGDEPVSQAPAQAEVRQLTAELVGRVEDLQSGIAADLSGEPQRRLYHEADAVLDGLLTAERHLSSKDGGAFRRAIGPTDRKLHGLVRRVRRLDGCPRSVRRAADRVLAADAELHFGLSGGRPKPEELADLVRRQAGSLAAEAQALSESAAVTLADSPTAGTLPAGLRRLAEAAGRFDTEAETRESAPQLREAFAAVRQPWALVTERLSRLPPRENVSLLRSAGRFDRLYGRLHDLLGVEGPRPTLTVRS